MTWHLSGYLGGAHRITVTFAVPAGVTGPFISDIASLLHLERYYRELRAISLCHCCLWQASATSALGPAPLSQMVQEWQKEKTLGTLLETQK